MDIQSDFEARCYCQNIDLDNEEDIITEALADHPAVQKLVDQLVGTVAGMVADPEMSRHSVCCFDDEDYKRMAYHIVHYLTEK